MTLRSAAALEPFTAYTATVGTGLDAWNGTPLAAPVSWSFSTGPGTPPLLTTRTPAAGAVGVATDSAVEARFDRQLDPASVTASSFVLAAERAEGPPLPAQLSYDDASRTARLVPDARLAQSTSYTAELTTAIRAQDGTPMAAPESWSFTSGTELQVTGRTPAPFATGISPATVVRAVFSRDVDPATLTADQLPARGSGRRLGARERVLRRRLAGRPRLTPAAPLALLTGYTATLAGTIRAADGAPLAGTSWSFTTALSAPAAPAVTATTPAADAAGVPNGTAVSASFDSDLDPATVGPQSFTLTPEGGAPVAAALAYDAAARRATLTPQAPLAVGVRYTARLSTGDPLQQRRPAGART